MEHIWDRLIKALCLAAGAVAGWVGGWPPMMIWLAGMMVADYASGVIVAACGRSPKTEAGGLSSKVGFIGLAKKGFILLIVLAATMLDQAIGGGHEVFTSATVGYYIANEGLSLLENAALLGVPFPERVKKALEVLREKNGKSEEPEK